MPEIARRTLLAAMSASVFFPGLRGRAAGAVTSGYALSLYGDIKYPPGFEHFDYVRPDAPKGGLLRVSSIGTFDNLNPFILKGVSFVRVANDFMTSGALFDSLMAGSADEPSTAYGLIAETAEVADDGLSIAFTLRPEARFHDGSPIRADDVVWTYETLTTRGHPLYRVTLADVAGVERVDERRVRFRFKASTDRQLPLTVASLPVLPAVWWAGREFDRPTLEPLLGSAAYRVAKVEAGRSMTWERVRDYWAADLPVNRGTGNFDTVQVDFYRDNTVQREAFKAGLIDVREEATAADWFTAYDFPAVAQGLVVKEEVSHDVPRGMQAFYLNTRRPLFQDVRVRRALGYALDFNWYNKTYFYDSYKRNKSYFNNSELGSSGLPDGPERELLERYRGRVAEAVFTEVFDPPTYADSGEFRDGMRAALALLKEAGWTTKERRLVHAETDAPFEFEFMNDEPRLERVILPWLQNLERIGIAGRLRSVDAAQADNRMRDFDYDVISVNLPASLNPGTELRHLFSSAAARTPGTFNLAGIEDPVVDELIELVINAASREDLVVRTRALDRVLLHGHYCVPNWHTDTYRVAYWNKFGKPRVHPPYVSMPAGAVPRWWLEAAATEETARRQEDLEGP